MKILFSHYLIDDDCPPVRTNRAISQGLRNLGHEVCLHRSAVPSQPVSHHPSAAPARRRSAQLRGKLWFSKITASNLAMARRDRQAIQEFQPDVILCRQDAYCVSMAMAARQTKVPLVIYADAPVAYESRMYPPPYRWHPPFLAEALESWGLKQCSAITATSHPTVAKIREYGLKAPIHIIPNGLHPERYPERSDTRSRSEREALGITAPRVLAFQGGFRAFHGIDKLRDLMLATAHRNDIHWLLIGDGPERTAVEATVSGRVKATFLGNRKPEEIGQLLSLVDVAIAPHNLVKGIFYLSPLKVIEYAAAGCAVIASAQGDIPWLLDYGKAGVLLGSNDVESWAAEVNALLDDPERCRTLGQTARAYVMKNFTWQAIANQYAQVLQSVVSPTTHAAPLG